MLRVLRALRRLIARGLLLSALLPAAALAQADNNELVMLTGNTGGVYYPLGIALARIWERTLPGTRVTVQSTQASVENFNLLQQRRGSFAFGQGDVMSDAFKGNAEAGFPSSRDKLRMVAALFPNYLHLVAARSAKVRTVADLRGKRVSVGALRSGNELNARVLLGAAGMSYADLRRVDYVPYNDAVALMRDGQIDALIVSAGLGVKAVADLADSVAVEIVPLPPEIVARSGGVFAPAVIPANTYAGQDKPVVTAALINFLVTHSEVPPLQVYAAVKALYAHLGELRSAHPAAREIQRERALQSRPIALHPGAERYFREVGLLP
ncbi:TAXI family TRAP transporter solute-binding subunit [Aquincola sp. S2]|uniref:TAXI family TRAP transporter solute-binding subunit n=1 Tax=Pseudaquabacterium terrae TaxID=2732868 RepID=A0ABX2ELU7_9BURK|nr:TAXI family TRAP transporter solute-binding subunit [Aquabacterium terrae]NRF69586.1 TAXI family TRAP transporter solute-binding subunit [Aquabacterium terrae]